MVPMTPNRRVGIRPGSPNTDMTPGPNFIFFTIFRSGASRNSPLQISFLDKLFLLKPYQEQDLNKYLTYAILPLLRYHHAMNLQQKVKLRFSKTVPLAAQYSISISIFFSLALLGSWLNPFIGYQGLALIMLVALSLLAMLFEILPVLLAAILSALTWNYFFTPPIYAFNFENRADIFIFIMYFIIAIVNTILSFKTKARNRKIREMEDKEKIISFYNTILDSLSHELRTPIATIIGSIDSMKEQNERLSAIHKNELEDEISKAALRLNQHVENLLGLSRLESGMIKLNLDWIDINELIHRMIQKYTTPDPSHTITFLPGENLPLFKLDAVLIEQVIFNLLQNAMLYTPEKTEITIRTFFQNQNCKITFMDNGPGFPISSIKSAFDKFYRIGQSNSRGTGLGLSIVKGFIEAHNGNVTLKNNVNGGACFVIELPVETSFIQNLKDE